MNDQQYKSPSVAKETDLAIVTVFLKITANHSIPLKCPKRESSLPMFLITFSVLSSCIPNLSGSPPCPLSKQSNATQEPHPNLLATNDGVSWTTSRFENIVAPSHVTIVGSWTSIPITMNLSEQLSVTSEKSSPFHYCLHLSAPSSYWLTFQTHPLHSTYSSLAQRRKSIGSSVITSSQLLFKILYSFKNVLKQALIQ